ncbi:hypothetical protein BDN71DRAFT_1432072 [Pleurotus eryngii]|uniref:Uncharacterized protein n=1 Tax=Pleurotus eryngii TaxID=5323 RepID=A0A9P6DEF3_PLEER|nr:hypothetical protein BDN71DRAFT_1432072 [Pleurotus eryngii]
MLTHLQGSSDGKRKENYPEWKRSMVKEIMRDYLGLEDKALTCLLEAQASYVSTPLPSKFHMQKDGNVEEDEEDKVNDDNCKLLQLKVCQLWADSLCVFFGQAENLPVSIKKGAVQALQQMRKINQVIWMLDSWHIAVKMAERKIEAAPPENPATERIACTAENILDLMCKHVERVPCLSHPSAVFFLISYDNFLHAWEVWLEGALRHQNAELTVCNAKGPQEHLYYVHELPNYEELNGCVITTAPEDECLDLKAEEGSSSAKKPQYYHPDELNLKQIKPRPEVYKLCKRDVTLLVNDDRILVGAIKYNAFVDEMQVELDKHLRASSNLHDVQRGAGFCAFAWGSMKALGSQVLQGGNAGSGYGPYKDMDAREIDGIHCMFNHAKIRQYSLLSVADALIYTAQGLYKPVTKHVCKYFVAQGMDLMGSGSGNLYVCHNYCSHMHKDRDASTSICMQNKKCCKKGEWNFVYPRWGVYLQNGPNTLWLFDAKHTHGSTMPSKSTNKFRMMHRISKVVALKSKEQREAMVGVEVLKIIVTPGKASMGIWRTKIGRATNMDLQDALVMREDFLLCVEGSLRQAYNARTGSSTSFATDHDLSITTLDGPGISLLKVELSSTTDHSFPLDEHLQIVPDPVTPQCALQIFCFLTNKRYDHDTNERLLPKPPSAFSSPSDEGCNPKITKLHFSEDTSFDADSIAPLTDLHNIPSNMDTHSSFIYVSTSTQQSAFIPHTPSKRSSASIPPSHIPVVNEQENQEAHGDNTQLGMKATLFNKVKVIMNGPSKVIVTAPTPYEWLSLWRTAVKKSMFRPPPGMVLSPASSLELSPIAKEMMLNLRQQRMKVDPELHLEKDALIDVNSVPFSIKYNLGSALQSLWHEEEEKVLPAEDDSDTAMDFVRDSHKLDVDDPKLQLSGITPPWHTTQVLFTRLWWGCMRIVQELFMSKNMVVWCGEKEVGVDQFWELVAKEQRLCVQARSGQLCRLALATWASGTGFMTQVFESSFSHDKNNVSRATARREGNNKTDTLVLVHVTSVIPRVKTTYIAQKSLPIPMNATFDSGQIKWSEANASHGIFHTRLWLLE